MSSAAVGKKNDSEGGLGHGKAMSPAPSHIAPPAAPAHQKVKILLVDDTPENLISLEAALDSLGEELVFAHSGREALRYLLEDNFGAILLDVKMPDMDGFETAELIRSRPRSRNTPILFLTGYKSDEHLFRGYDLGAVDFLFKPIVPEVLRSKVSVFVELSRKAELLERQAAVLREQTATLQKAEQQFRSLLEAAPDAMIICQASGHIALVNTCTERLFGYSREELLNRHIHTLVPEWTFANPSASPDENSLDGVIQQAGPPIELDGRRRDGTAIPIEISRSPLQVGGELLITTAVRDISVRKRIERERAAAEEQVRNLNAHLEQLNAHLEERVRERTEALVKSNDELAQFAYIASHDLQEPLRTVSLYTQALSDRYTNILKGEGLTFVNFIVDNAARMESLIRDLLEYSSLDAAQDPRMEPVSCGEALDLALANLEARIVESGAFIQRYDLPTISGDLVQLTRLFQNLVGNSIKYRHADRTPRINISATRSDRDWLFSVRDNGIGIDPQYAERVFGIFKRLHGRDNPGTGMGLAICRKIVSTHGGRIWLDPSSDEGGATFLFMLPCAEQIIEQQKETTRRV
ncbi:MAG TPA: ATP-binding protein [Bryobacteraceae bacterium]|nr:ATP-binding protein [Bryobacteraceae bacterium]